MKNFVSLITLCFFISCGLVRKSNNVACDRLIAKSIASKEMKKYGFKITEYLTSIEEGKDYFLIIYTDTVKYRTGGGGQIKIDKNNCRIIAKTLYQ